MPSAPDSLTEADVNKALAEWRQGDCVLGELWFVHRVAGSLALTPASQAATIAGSDLAETPEAGLVVLTQTCDLVRDCRDRPFVEVAPLVEVDAETLHSVERRRRRVYAFVPGVASKGLVADLDRTMTVEKSVVAQWQRIPGCRNDQETRELANTLALRRERFAFPDDFNLLVARLRKRLLAKHDKQSGEGTALQDLREIRVQAAPEWDADEVSLFFWFIRDQPEGVVSALPWHDLLRSWLSLVKPTGRFVRVEGQVVDLDDMTARDYVESDPLDLSHLSTPATGEEG